MKSRRQMGHNGGLHGVAGVGGHRAEPVSPNLISLETFLSLA